MKEHIKYARARDQLYHLKVAWRQLEEGISPHRRTPGLLQALEIVETIIDAACHSFEAGHILEVLINEYVPTPLPGFEDVIEAFKEAEKWDGEPEWVDGFYPRDHLFDEAGGNDLE